MKAAVRYYSRSGNTKALADAIAAAAGAEAISVDRLLAIGTVVVTVLIFVYVNWQIKNGKIDITSTEDLG